MPTLQRVYRFRMQPNKLQGQALLRQAGARRWVWNWALARRKTYFAEHSNGIPASQLSAELTALKIAPATAWLKEADSQALQQTLKDLDRAFVNFFEKRAHFPRFKAMKRTAPAFRIPQRVTVADGNVYVPKVGLVRIRQSQAVEGATKSATFKRNACGHWHVCLVVAFTMPDVRPSAPDPAKAVGLDAGLKEFAVLSNAERVPIPQFYRKAQRKLRRAQRAFCRRKPGSNRRAQARQRVARVHERTANQRQDFLHKLSTDLIGRFDAIFIEDLNVSGLARTKLAKSFMDAAHGEFRRQLQYKAVWNRKHLGAVGRFYPSSKTCHDCGAVNHALALSDRQWVCVCGTVHDRDHNASLNIRDEGLRLLAVGHTERQNARGAGVRPANVQAVGAEPRIPRL
jgi:putative transposase